MTVRLWNAETGEQPLGPLVGHQDWVCSVAFSSDGKRIVSGSKDKTIRLWDVESGEHQPPFEGHQDSVNSVAFSPDGERIVSGSSDTTVRLWNAQTGEQLQPPLEGHRDSVLSVVFSSDGKLIVSGSKDMTVRLWNADTWEQLRLSLAGHQQPLSVVPSPTIVSGSRYKNLSPKWQQHYISFSPQSEHGLFEPVELFDQMSSPSRPGSVFVDVTSSGWSNV